MPRKHKQVIAQEIVDQVRASFKKQKEDAAEKHSTSENIHKVECEYMAKYEPGENFEKIFSELMSGKQKETNNVGIDEKPELHETHDDCNKAAEPVLQNSDDRNDLIKTTDSPNIHPIEEKIEEPSQPSAFERLSTEAKPADLNDELKRSELAQLSHLPDPENKQHTADNSSASISVFRRLSRNANGN